MKSPTDHTLYELTHLDIMVFVLSEDVVSDLLQVVDVETPARNEGDHLQPQPPGESGQT